MNEIESDEAFKDRILEVMPAGHTYTAEDLGNAYGDAVDRIGAKYGLIRKGLLESQINIGTSVAALEEHRRRSLNWYKECDGSILGQGRIFHRRRSREFPGNC